jgi:hypothetical protein
LATIVGYLAKTLHVATIARWWIVEAGVSSFLHIESVNIATEALASKNGAGFGRGKSSASVAMLIASPKKCLNQESYSSYRSANSSWEITRGGRGGFHRRFRDWGTSHYLSSTVMFPPSR